MCVSNHFVELQAYELSEKIRESSLYTFVRFEKSKNNNMGSEGEGLDLITQVILQDNDGALYPVEPNLNGLRFAKKEITYNEYKKLQSKETFTAFSIFFLAIGVFSIGMVGFIKFFT
ncbi:hypothetical protein V7112_07505 [Bacillus sp. JJ1566]|uniref:hypothetical protein n=1 Tax=Bacillus sp. JJ1566 TaxID=3122961 RepID=UPI002FFF73AB